MGQPLERIAKQYEVVAKIREGGMGEIYQVRHRLLDEVRVVKVLRPRYTSDAKLSARFAQEARAAIQLRHPNIVQIFDFTLDDTGAGLIVMEYIRGADLKHLIASGRPPSLALALEIGRQSLRALGFLHRHGFVHRDVSPDNLMLTEDVDGRPLVKLIDLGIAKRLDSDRQLTTSGMFLGKYRYASPEHFGDRGAEGVEARSDLYTFGLVFYELVTGRYPLPGEGTAQLVAGHLYKQPLGFAETDPDGRIPQALRRALLRSLAKDPGERFASAEDFIAEIEELQRLSPVDAGCCDEARRWVASELAKARWQAPGSTGERLVPELDSGTPDRGSPDRAAPDRRQPTRVTEGAPSAAPRPAEARPAEARPAEARPAEAVDRSACDRRLDEALGLVESDRLTAARELLEEARQLGSGDPDLVRRAAAVEERIAAGERREEELSEVVGRVEELLERGALMEADRVLFQAAESYGFPRRLAAIRRRLDEIHHLELVSEVRSLISQAEENAGSGDYDRALEIVAKARVVAPADPELEREIEASEGRYRALVEQRRSQERERREETRRRIAELVRRAGIAYEAVRFDEAADDLRRALELAPGDSWIRGRLAEAEAQQRQLEERRRRQAEAGSYLRQAEEAERCHDILKARLLVARALELDPESPIARARAMELDRRPIEPVLTPEAAAAVDRIEALVGSGETLAAWRAVQAAIDELGDIEPFTTLRKKIAEALLDDSGGTA